MRIVNYACQYAVQLAEDGLGIYQVVKMNECDESIPFELPVMIPNISKIFEPGWAKRPKHGKGYGVKYINSYKTFIKECFDAGAAVNGTKWSPASILEAIKNRDPTNLEIPTETEIRGYISTLIQKQKNPVAVPKPTISEEMLSWLKAKANLTKAPLMKDIYNLLYEAFPDHPKVAIAKVLEAYRAFKKEKTGPKVTKTGQKNS